MYTVCVKVLVQNRKAYHDYFIEETYEAGVELFGTEVKSLRRGKASVREAYVEVRKNEVYIVGMNISPYEMGNIYNRDPLRDRKLLLHKKEISELRNAVMREGYTIVPTKIYLNPRGLVKIEIGVAKGKKLYDKRESIQKKDVQRNIQREMRERQR